MTETLRAILVKRWAMALALVVLSLTMGMSFSPTAHAAGGGGDKQQPNSVECQYLKTEILSSNSFSNAGYTLHVYLIGQFDNHTGYFCGLMYAEAYISYGQGMSGGYLDVTLYGDPNYTPLAGSAGDTPNSPGDYYAYTGNEGTLCGYVVGSFSVNSIFLETYTSHVCP